MGNVETIVDLGPTVVQYALATGLFLWEWPGTSFLGSAIGLVMIALLPPARPTAEQRVTAVLEDQAAAAEALSAAEGEYVIGLVKAIEDGYENPSPYELEQLAAWVRKARARIAELEKCIDPFEYPDVMAPRP